MSIQESMKCEINYLISSNFEERNEAILTIDSPKFAFPITGITEGSHINKFEKLVLNFRLFTIGESTFAMNLAYSDGASVGNPSRFGRAVSKIQFTEIST